jgi:RNA polymerase sigma factor (TIGR02999 family)
MSYSASQAAVERVEPLMALTQAGSAGKDEAREKLFTALYGKLRQMAQRELRFHASATLSPTTLLHETFLNLSQRESAASFERARFLVYAGRAMRGLVIDYLRSRQAQKRGSEFEITALSTNLGGAEDPDANRDVEQLNEALAALERIDARLAECVDLKFFCGFSFVEIARIRNVSERTVQRDWNKARVLLNRLMSDPGHQWVLD